MGLGAMLRSSTKIDVTQTADDGSTTASTFTIVDLAPSWQGKGGYRGGMGIPGAWRAATLASDLIGSLPLDAYRKGVGASAGRLVDPTPMLLEQPNPPFTRITTLASMMLDLLWNGNAIALRIGFDADGNTELILPVPAESVWVRRVLPGDDIPYPIGSIAYFIAPTFLFGANFNGRWYGQHEVLHILGPSSPSSVRGWGVLENHIATLDLTTEQARQARNATGAGIPTGVLKSENPDLDEVEAGTLKTGWMNAQRDRTIAVLNATTSFESLAWNPTEAQLVEARKFGLHEIALIFGLDPSWLGINSRGNLTYSNIEQEALNLLKFSLGGHITRFEAAFSDLLAFGTYARFDLDYMLRSDTLSRYQAYQIGLTSGFLADDEVRAREDLPPLTPAQRAQMHPPATAALPAGDSAAQQQRAKHAGNAAELQRYWTKDPEGLAKWSTERKPYTALVGHLTKYVGAENAQGLAATYYHRVFGQWPSDGPL